MWVQGEGPRKEVTTRDADTGKSVVLVQQPEAHEQNAIDFNTTFKTTLDISLVDGEADDQENSQCPRPLSPPLFLALYSETANCKITSFCLS